MSTTRHLDLGCGPLPRNPYQRDELFGVDIAPPAHTPGCVLRRGNLTLEPIPFDTSRCAAHGRRPGHAISVHRADGRDELRAAAGRADVCADACYPSRGAFQDPTHVDIITDRTRLYFTGDSPQGRMHGFMGQFVLRCADWVVPRDALDATQC